MTCECLVDTAWSQFGSADILVNNAGMEKKSDFWDTTEAEYDQVMAVNLRGPFFLTQAFVRRLRDAKKPGRIINISSVHEDMAFPGICFLLLQQGRAAHADARPGSGTGAAGDHGEQCCAGRDCDADQQVAARGQAEAGCAAERTFRWGGWARPKMWRALVAFLASDDASYVTGSTFVMDGGLMRNYHEQ